MTNAHEEKIQSLSFLMLPVPGGDFLMGSSDDDKDDVFGWEKPQCSVNVSSFYMGQYPVTQDIWQAVMGKNPSFFLGARRPVEKVSWHEAKEFIEKLNEVSEKTRPPGYEYRLPTEAEWEYAACGGRSELNKHMKYSGSNKLKEVGWFSENSHGETKPVGLRAPNALGLYDMSGNVWEWCEDDWHANYNEIPLDGKAWIDVPERGARRVYRGGSWNFSPQYCRSASRINSWPDHRYNYLGFRLVLALQSVG